jgi:hypothetical protein
MGRGFMYKAIAILLVVLFGLTGCATESAIKRQHNSYDKATEARIRVFGNNGFYMHFYEGKERKEIAVSGGLSQGFGALFWASSDVSIGMPESHRSKNKQGFGFGREFYAEYVVKAGESIVFTMGRGAAGQQFYCRQKIISFTPSSGRDYDVYLYVTKNECNPTVEEIQPDGTGKPVDRYIP